MFQPDRAPPSDVEKVSRSGRIIKLKTFEDGTPTKVATPVVSWQLFQSIVMLMHVAQQKPPLDFLNLSCCP